MAGEGKLTASHEHSYTPSFVLCILAIVLFAISCVVHIVQLVHYRAWYFIPLTLACFLETIGYIFRSLSSKNDPYNLIWFVVQYFLIVVAPVFISASIYICLNRLIAWAKLSGHKARNWWLGPKLILWGFVTVDIFTTILQVTGAALIGSFESSQHDPAIANNILLAGLAIQSFSFTIFLIVLMLFRITLARDPNVQSTASSQNWYILALSLASLLIYLRTIFRLAETSQGIFGSLSTHEVFFATLEFAPVVLAVWLLAIWHPGRWLKVSEVDG